MLVEGSIVRIVEEGGYITVSNAENRKMTVNVIMSQLIFLRKVNDANRAHDGVSRKKMEECY